MQKELTILFTSVGRRVELVQCFRNAARKLNRSVRIIGADNSKSAPALYFCDKAIQICRIDNEKYIPELLDICRQEEVDLLIPTIDTDLLVLSKNKRVFGEVGTKVLISEEREIAICRDKRYTFNFFMKCGLKTPTTVDNVNEYSGDYPCFIKPKDGSSSINAYRIDTYEELVAYSQQIKDYIIQPFIEGEEYTVDILCDFYGNPIFITPRERVAVRSGEVLKSRIVHDRAMLEENLRIVESFKPCGPITVQLIRKADTGENYYIEINPRFGGGAPLSMKAGADSASALIRLCLGEECIYQENMAKEGALYSRFDQSICVSSDEVKSRRKIVRRLKQAMPICMQYEAIIFDLDDTLYSEVSYVKSGFHAVAELLTDIPNAKQQLWEAFKDGYNAIDKVLTDNGLYTEERKNACLEAYRQHIPQIDLYEDAKVLLQELKKAGKKIGIITDGRVEGQKNKLAQLGLESYVREVIITDELAGDGNLIYFRKPASIAFELMRMRMDCQYFEMIYIGDNAQKDFDAPEQLGMGTIWFQNMDGLYYNKK